MKAREERAGIALPDPRSGSREKEMPGYHDASINEPTRIVPTMLIFRRRLIKKKSWHSNPTEE